MSRAPSRSGTSTPNMAIPYPLRLTHSSSNLRIPSSSQIPPVPAVPPHLTSNALSSATSSIENFDMSDGILVPDTDPDAEMDPDQVSAAGQMNSLAGDEESKKNLRAQLRRTLSKKQSIPDVSARSRRRGRPSDIEELSHDVADLYAPRQYFVLTDAGKPVFTNVPETEGPDLASTIGIVQALISVFIDEGDKLRTVNAGSTRITFLLRSPLYYFCVSSWGEPESVTRFHLEYLHLQILSIVTAQQLRKMFERRTNFDLRRLLGGAEPFLHLLLNKLEWDLAMSMSSLHCLKLDSTLRSRAAEALVPATKMKDILYIIMVARGRVITLVRPKKHSIHPSDLHILLNTIHAPSILNNSASASWLPICLPKFNSTGFVNTYVQFMRRDDEDELMASERSHSASDSGSPSGSTSSRHRPSTDEERPPPLESSMGIGLICVSGEPEFDVIRAWGESVTQKLEREGTLNALLQALRFGSPDYSVSELGIPGLRHFVYKSRSHVQVTVPVFEDPYDDLQERRRLITLYQVIHDALHAKSGQESTLKLQYLKTEKESVMGWITQPFELYLALSPRLPKTAVVGAANAVAKWVKKEESKLFLRDAPVF